MEFQPDVRSEKNKGILSDGILGPLTELHIEWRSQEINAPSIANFCLWMTTRSYSAPKVKLESNGKS